MTPSSPFLLSKKFKIDLPCIKSTFLSTLDLKAIIYLYRILLVYLVLFMSEFFVSDINDLAYCRPQSMNGNICSAISEGLTPTSLDLKQILYKIYSHNIQKQLNNLGCFVKNSHFRGKMHVVVTADYSIMVIDYSRKCFVKYATFSNRVNLTFFHVFTTADYSVTVVNYSCKCFVKYATISNHVNLTFFSSFFCLLASGQFCN